MHSTEWFGNWFNSHYYHLLYSNRSNTEANNFIQNLLNHLQPNDNSKILDVACGKGRHSIALAAKGFDVTGIDLSIESIQAAKQHENEHLHFFTHDMRLPFYINYFDIALNIFTSFGYFNTQREHNNAIRTIAQSVKQKGIIVIDYLNTLYEESILIDKTEKQIDNLNFIITKWHTATHFYKKIEVANDLNTAAQHLSTERVAKFSLQDFTQMLALQNVYIQSVFGDYNLGNYQTNTSPRMIMIAQKS